MRPCLVLAALGLFVAAVALFTQPRAAEPPPVSVAQVSKPAVSPTSKSAGAPQLPARRTCPAPADLETGDTAGLETCATGEPPPTPIPSPRDEGAGRGAPSNSPAPAPTPAPAPKPPANDKPLLLEDDKPLLLLDEAPATNGRPAKGIADNARCQVCHLNVSLEEMTVVHAKAEIGCAKCHGASDAHIADESWASGGNGTAPEIMYPKYKVISFCKDCHRAPNRTKPKPCPKLAGVRTTLHICTDCHGKHRLPERKCKWK